jgi:hypothetical protein
MRGTAITLVSLTWLAVSAVPLVAQKSTSTTVTLDDRAWQMLVDALEASKTASPAVRAKVGLEFAKQLDQDNKKSDELKVSREAYLATLADPEPPYNTIGWIQSDILRTMMKNIGPAPVEELLPKMDQEQRGLAFDLLVSRYTTDRDWNHAMDTLRRAPVDTWFPFGPANALMKALPAQDVGARREIFEMVYAIYKNGGTAPAALEPMIEGFWRELPREQVVEVIPLILRGAIRGEIYFIKRPPHFYEKAKAELLPILRELDPAKADEWERNEQKTFEDIRQTGPWPQPRRLEVQQAGAVKSATPPVSPAPYQKPPGSPKPRVVAGCLEDEPWCQQNRVEHALQSVEEHLKKNEMDLAKAGISRGYWIALSQWKLDADPVDPNQVIKTHWPSTVNWEAFSVMASRISPDYALQRVKEIPDAEIRLLVRTMLARAWLDHRPMFPCPSLHSNYHDEGACIAYQAYMPRELFSWANNWD